MFVNRLKVNTGKNELLWVGLRLNFPAELLSANHS